MHVCAHVWVGVHVCVIKCIYSYVRERETHTIECWRRAQCGRHSRTWPLRWSPTERERERGGDREKEREDLRVEKFTDFFLKPVPKTCPCLLAHTQCPFFPLAHTQTQTQTHTQTHTQIHTPTIYQRYTWHSGYSTRPVNACVCVCVQRR